MGLCGSLASKTLYWAALTNLLQKVWHFPQFRCPPHQNCRNHFFALESAENNYHNTLIKGTFFQSELGKKKQFKAHNIPGKPSFRTLDHCQKFQTAIFFLQSVWLVRFLGPVSLFPSFSEKLTFLIWETELAILRSAKLQFSRVYTKEEASLSLPNVFLENGK